MTATAPEPSNDRALRSGRRALLRGAAGGLFALAAMDALAHRAALALGGAASTVADNGGYGPLRRLARTDPASGFRQELWLPEGFTFRVFSTAGTPMSDGHLVPLGHDGMACFPTAERGVWRLVRNHEERTKARRAVASGSAPSRYDRRGPGGTTTLGVHWDAADGKPVFDRAWQSLSGTVANCAGGPTPWGSWLSCEETTDGPGSGWDTEHGYVFEVPAAADAEVVPVPLKAMGRFVHEAVAVDPDTGVVYETEDRGKAGFYRFLPDKPGRLRAGGRLQMLKIKGVDAFDTRGGQRQGKALDVEWVDIRDPDPENAEERPGAVAAQGFALGAALFGRLEGCWWGNGAVYIASTSGGNAGEGQIWEYRPDAERLRLVFESPDRAILSYPDNLTVTPAGSLLLCEDTTRSSPTLHGLTPEGAIFPFCRHDGRSEWCGATFSPDGRVLFVNMQGDNRGDPADPGPEPGRTLAIWGPWGQGPL